MYLQVFGKLRYMYEKDFDHSLEDEIPIMSYTESGVDLISSI